MGEKLIIVNILKSGPHSRPRTNQAVADCTSHCPVWSWHLTPWQVPVSWSRHLMRAPPVVCWIYYYLSQADEKPVTPRTRSVVVVICVSTSEQKRHRSSNWNKITNLQRNTVSTIYNTNRYKATIPTETASVTASTLAEGWTWRKQWLI